MDFQATFFIRLRGKAHGPFIIEQLRELVRTGAVTESSEVATSAEGPWAQLQTQPMRAMLFPSRGGAKPPEFERANRNSSPAIDHHALIAAANRPKSGGPAHQSPPAPAMDRGIQHMLALNLQKDQARGFHELAPPPPRKSRRKRDYQVLLFGIGALIFAVLLSESVLAVSIQTMAARMPEQFWPILRAVVFHSPIMAFGLAAFVFYWAALTWLMYGLMDDY